MRTEAKPVNLKTGKVESKRVKGKVKRAFYYEGKLRNVGDVFEGFRHDLEQWPSKVQLIEEGKESSAHSADAEKKDDKSPKDSKSKEEKK